MSVLYHGSPFSFNQFDYKMIGRNGTQNGYGFYFTNDISLALSYARRGNGRGFLYHAKFQGKKALSDTRVTLPKGVIRKLLVTLHSLDGYLNNYGEVAFEGLSRVLNTAMNNIFHYPESDTEIVGGIINSFGAVEPVLQTLYHLAGYDHVKVRDPKTKKVSVYVILVPSAIRITGVKPV